MSVGARPSGVLFRKKKGFTVPKAYLEKALDQNPTFYGILYMNEGEISNVSGQQATIEELVEIFDAFKDHNIYVHLGYDPNGQAYDANIQPFYTYTVSNKPKFVSMIAGDFSRFYVQGEKVSAEANVSSQILQPWINDFMIEAKEDTDLVLDLFKQAYVTKLINGLSDSGIILLMNDKGKSIRFNSCENYKDFSWGWVSNHYNYVENAPAESKKDFKGARVLEEITPKPETSPTVLPVPEQQELPVQPSIPNEVIKKALDFDPANGGTVFEKEGEYWIKPPASLNNMGHKKIRAWYHETFGSVPKQQIWKRLQPMKAPDQSLFGPSTPISAKPKEEVKQPEPQIVVDNTQVEKEKPETPVVVKGQDKTTMADKGRILSLFTDKSSNKIFSPEDIEAFWKVNTPFVKQLGLDGLEDTFHWSKDALIKLAAPVDHGGLGRHDLVVQLLCDYRIAYIKLLLEKDTTTIVADATEAEKPVQEEKPVLVKNADGKTRRLVAA